MKKNKKVLAFVSALIVSVLFSLLFKWGQTGNPFQAETIMYGTIFFLNALITGSLGFWFYKKFSKKSSYELKRNVIAAFCLFIVLALIISLTLVSIGVYIFYLVEDIDTSNFVKNLFQLELTGALKQFSVWLLIGSVFFFYIIWRKAVEREQILREENLTYRYRTLKSQVNPHFLFNSLNTLSELIYSDAREADSFLQKLSGIYRYVLENEEKELIPLEEEVKFVMQYFNLQKQRDNDKIALIINLEDTKNYQIIPVSMQMLVENALKHNSISREKPLQIRITRNEDNIVVSNNIQRKNTIERTTRMGLLNLSERVRLILGKELIVSEVNDEFVVKLPIIRTIE
jgi:two-component system, LytTR family, sensor kinase